MVLDEPVSADLPRDCPQDATDGKFSHNDWTLSMFLMKVF